jgi:flagellin
MRELAVQAANGTNQATDRDALDAELQQLVAEIERVADSTQFNGNTLFDGTFTSDIQVGADNAVTDAFNQITVGTNSFIDAQTATLGTTGTTTISETLSAARGVTGLTSGDLLVNGVNVGAVSLGGNGSYAANLAQAIENADSDVVATVGTSTLNMTDLGAWTDESTGDDISMTINGIDILENYDSTGTALSAAVMDAAIDSKQSELAAAGITYTGDVANGTLSFTRADGGNIVFTNTIAGTVGTAGFANNTFAATGTDRGFGDVTLTSDFEIVLGTTGTIANAGTTAQTVSSGTATGTALTSIDLQNAGNSQTALTSIDSALNTVNLARSNIGAEYSRLDSVSSNLASTVENYSAARSRIQDADFAVESANLARTQVLQQAGISVLAQANALPQQVLALLQ